MFVNGVSKPLSIVLVLFAMSALAQGPTQIKPGLNFFSKQQDVQLGQELAAQVRKQRTVIKDPTLTAYVNAVGKRLVASREAKASGFRVHLRGGRRPQHQRLRTARRTDVHQYRIAAGSGQRSATCGCDGPRDVARDSASWHQPGFESQPHRIAGHASRANWRATAV